MPFTAAADVFVLSVTDTGEIHAAKPEQIYDVKHDSDGSYGEHHEMDLKGLPYYDKIPSSSYFSVIKAWRDGTRRKLTKHFYRNDGRKIY